MEGSSVIMGEFSVASISARLAERMAACKDRQWRWLSNHWLSKRLGSDKIQAALDDSISKDRNGWWQGEIQQACSERWVGRVRASTQ
eukprot:1158550-Pelagomonas_calceolata.AAC.2